MAGLYARWIDRWETRLATRDTNRVVRPFEWGLEWLDAAQPAGDPRRAVLELARRAVAQSDEFFSAPPREDYRLEGAHLTFSSALPTPYPENNTVHADFFPAGGGRGRAVVVLPQWNSDAGGHAGLCRLLSRLGITALRMSLAYHDRRMPGELERADYHVSSNIGRTIHAVRQSVVDARGCLQWLEARGYRRLGVLGTSLGSCVAFITAAHDLRVRAGVFNHVSAYFSDVVWTGLSTRHIRQGMSGSITQEELREAWRVISPASYAGRLKGRDLRSLLIWARYDTTFLPAYSKQVIEAFRKERLPYRELRLPCAHYTTGCFPFNVIDGFSMCGFLVREL